MNNSKKLNRAKGNASEAIACNFLRSRGFSIIKTNYRSKYGEIDIIATSFTKGKNPELVYHFIEVKMRMSNAFGFGREAVDKVKQKRIRKTAQDYLIKNNIYNEVYCCFDVIEFEGTIEENKIEHIENCF